jgi:tRNA U34 5-carboxymethylaminomethyl modifying enzyme MnmG/GidA
MTPQGMADAPAAHPAERPAVIVVGAGLTGSEAAWGLAERGVATLLVTTSLDTIANLPADHWRFEPPASGLLASLAAEVRGPDGWSARGLHRAVKRELERSPALHVLQSTVVGLRSDGDGRLIGVDTWEGVTHHADRVALCLGSFIHARLSLGTSREVAGRLSELADDALYHELRERGLRFEARRLVLPGTALAPGYEVRCRVLAPGEVAEDGAVGGLPGLYAYGLCAGAEADLAVSAAAGVAASRWLAEPRPAVGSGPDGDA